MDWSRVRERVAVGDRAELVRGPGDLAAAGRAVCAFANGVGGLLVFGADDAGRFVGVSGDPDRLQERLASFLQTGCSAPVSASPGRRRTPSGWVHWIEVPRQRGPEPLGFRGRFWIRRGRTTVEPSPRELQELFNAFGFILTEEQVLRGAGVRDLDLEAFRGFLRAQDLDTEEAPQPAAENDLRNHGVLGEAGGRLHPTLYGILAFGRDPQGHRQTRSFLIRCAAYAGDDPAAEVILAGEAGGRLDEQVRRAIGWFRSLGHTESFDHSPDNAPTARRARRRG